MRPSEAHVLGPIQARGWDPPLPFHKDTKCAGVSVQTRHF